MLALASCTMLLTACGGGGSGADSGPVASAPNNPVVPPTQTTPTTPSVTPADLQTTVAAPTYAAGSQELVFFNALNDFRAKLNLGLVAQNAALDTADQNHVKYLLTNTDVDYAAVDPKTGVPYMHEEDAARAGFTGATPLDRAKFGKYAGTWVNELVTYGSGNGAAASFASLVASVYHRQNMMAQYPRDFGISVGGDAKQTTVLNFGSTEGKWQRNASDYIGVYPADKQTGVGLTTYPELPNPYPEISLAEFATKTSFPISFATEWTATLKVDSFTVTEAGQTAPLDARLIVADNDPQKLLGKYTAYLVGKAPFKANTTYNVKFKGTVNGAAVSKDWSFTTVAK